MSKILILGAGRSSTSLIDYLHRYRTELNLQIFLCEQNTEILTHRLNQFPGLESLEVELSDSQQTIEKFRKVDLVISMLPAFLHIDVANLCVAAGTNMLTAS